MPFKKFPILTLISLITNISLAIILVYIRQSYNPSFISSGFQSKVANEEVIANNTNKNPELGERHYLNYEEWIDLLRQEAKTIAQQKPDNLNLLLGDSIMLWFPPYLLPPDAVWLNQGISGDTSRGLLKRLNILDETKPRKIFIMIGINDLLKGIKDDNILANHLLIIRYLRKVHPSSDIIIQSILPHGANKATWEGKAKLLDIPNERIKKINQRLKEIAESEGVIFLDLYPLFADENGNLRMEFSTDGLHLASSGYQVWRSTLQVLNLVEFN